MFLRNKYAKWYFHIIENAKSTGYTEKHHIIPKSLGGYNRKDNIVSLTAKEHFICHLLLCKMTTGESRKKMLAALHCMQQMGEYNSRTYEYFKREWIETISGSNHWLFGKPSPTLGKTFTEEQRKRLAESHKGIPNNQLGLKRSVESRLKMSFAHKGRKQSPETIEKRVSKLRGRKRPDVSVRMTINNPRKRKKINANGIKFFN